MDIAWPLEKIVDTYGTVKPVCNDHLYDKVYFL